MVNEAKGKAKRAEGKEQRAKGSLSKKKDLILQPSEQAEAVRHFGKHGPQVGEKSKKRAGTSSRLRANNKNADGDWEKQKKKWYIAIGAIVLGVFLFNAILISTVLHVKKPVTPAAQPQQAYWFMLHRKSQQELFYRGVPGDATRSTLLRTFTVKTGIPGERPTPLPQLTGRKYWKIVDKIDSSENPETAPYFLTLDVPAPSEEPYGPSPYKECGGQQCSWVLPGAFGLHGIAGDPSRLGSENPGSSGCIRHRDEDITYLYNLLDPKKEEIRYYIEDI